FIRRNRRQGPRNAPTNEDLADRFLWDFRVEAIAESTDASNERSRFIAFDFLTEPQNVHVHGAIRHCAVMSPACIEQLFAAEHHAWPAHQKLEQTKLGCGERDLLTTQVHAAARAVEFQIPGFEKLRHRRLAAEMDLDSRDQLANEERLYDVIVR